MPKTISELVKNADLMWRQSVWSSTIAASIAAQFLKDGGLLSLPGAKPALGPTPGTEVFESLVLSNKGLSET
jgi:hypothetical protein